MTLAAYYYPASKSQKAQGFSGVVELHTLENGKREFTSRHHADTVREARALATRYRATPWNF